MRLSISSLLLAFAVAACSGGDGGGSGVDSSKVLTDLTDADEIALCEHFSSTEAGLEDDNAKITCYYQGISAALEGGDCQATTDACIAAEMPGEPEDCSTAGDEMYPSCASMVTVGDMEACFGAFFDQAANFADGLSCATDLAEFETVLSALPQACLDVQTKCPDLFEDEG